MSVFVLWLNANRKKGSPAFKVDQFLRKPGESLYPSQDDLSEKLLTTFGLLGGKDER